MVNIAFDLWVVCTTCEDFIVFLGGSLHVKGLPCVDGWGHRVSGNSVHIQRVVTNFVWFFQFT